MNLNTISLPIKRQGQQKTKETENHAEEHWIQLLEILPY